MSVLVCPVCQGQMREVSHEGVLIDTCTRCRGVWLDRGELEKLSSLMDGPPSSGGAPPAAHQAQYMQPPPPPQRYRDRDDDDDDDRRWGDRDGRYHRKSKVSRFLDFFD